MTITTALEGAEDLTRLLQLIPLEMEREILRDATREAMEPMLAAAKAKCPVYQGPPRDDITPGQLRDSLEIKPIRGRGFVGARVESGEGDFKGDTYYAMMVEFGHGIGKRSYAGRRTRNTTDSRPRVPENPFIRPAFDEQKNLTVVRLGEAVRAGLASIPGLVVA